MPLDPIEGALVASYLARGGRTLVCPTHTAAGALILQGKVRCASFRSGRAGRKPSLDTYETTPDAEEQPHPESARYHGQSLAVRKSDYQMVAELAHAYRAVVLCAVFDLPRYVWRGVLNHIAGRTVALGFRETYQ
jgi:hypothetical protein